jgi:hypothetical protein
MVTFIWLLVGWGAAIGLCTCLVFEAKQHNKTRTVLKSLECRLEHQRHACIDLDKACHRLTARNDELERQAALACDCAGGVLTALAGFPDSPPTPPADEIGRIRRERQDQQDQCGRS